MNRYGATAKAHWQRWLPNRYSQIKDPEAFFADLGDQVQSRVETLTPAIAGDDPKEETYLEKLGRLNMARLSAEGQALRELALLDPQEDAPTPSSRRS